MKNVSYDHKDPKQVEILKKLEDIMNKNNLLVNNVNIKISDFEPDYIYISFYMFVKSIGTEIFVTISGEDFDEDVVMDSIIGCVYHEAIDDELDNFIYPMIEEKRLKEEQMNKMASVN